MDKDAVDTNIMAMKLRKSGLTLYLGEMWIKEETEWRDDDYFPDCKGHHCLQIGEYVITKEYAEMRLKETGNPIICGLCMTRYGTSGKFGKDTFDTPADLIKDPFMVDLIKLYGTNEFTNKFGIELKETKREL